MAICPLKPSNDVPNAIFFGTHSTSLSMLWVGTVTSILRTLDIDKSPLRAWEDALNGAIAGTSWGNPTHIDFSALQGDQIDSFS